jgi:hypothetical protein
VTSANERHRERNRGVRCLEEITIDVENQELPVIAMTTALAKTSSSGAVSGRFKATKTRCIAHNHRTLDEMRRLPLFDQPCSPAAGGLLFISPKRCPTAGGLLFISPKRCPVAGGLFFISPKRCPVVGSFFFVNSRRCPVAGSLVTAPSVWKALEPIEFACQERRVATRESALKRRAGVAETFSFSVDTETKACVPLLGRGARSDDYRRQGGAEVESSVSPPVKEAGRCRSTRNRMFMSSSSKA